MESLDSNSESVERRTSESNKRQEVRIPSDGPNRSQFLLGPQFIDRESWTRLELGGELRLSTHPSLSVEQSQGDGCCLTLLGFLLDWSNPACSNREILDSLRSKNTDFDSCCKATAEIGGRWILIYQDQHTARLFHDASGLRQVCYTTSEADGITCCASEPELLSKWAKLFLDHDAIAFIDWFSERNADYWWPGNRLPFENAQALLPNHYLDLESGTSVRYWPVDRLVDLPAGQVRKRVSERLVGLMHAAANRFEIALGLSAGWDSRLLLAAARHIKNELSVYTYKRRSSVMPADHRDLVVPTRLLQRLGMEHDFIVQPASTDHHFASYFRSHSWRPHPRFASAMQAGYNYYRHEKVAVLGNVSSIGKVPYRKGTEKMDPVDGNVLANILGMGGQAFAAQALDEWLMDADTDLGYHILDLLCWEQRLGRWMATNCLEFDAGWKDILTPFNVRALMVDLLSCDESLRCPPTHTLYRDIMTDLWPDVLSEPINPRPRPSYATRLHRLFRRAVKRLIR